MRLRAARAGHDGRRDGHAQVERPVNHNVNVKLKQSTFNQTIAGGQSQTYPLTGAERTPGPVVCDIHPWMTRVVDGARQSLYHGDRRQGQLRDQERAGRDAEGRRLAGGREAGGFVTAPSGEEVSIKAGDTTVKEFKIDPGKLLAE